MNIQKKMQQAQAMQARMQEMQEKLGDMEVAGSSGGGLVNVVMTCKGAVRKVKISPDVINPSDAETLEDLVMAAINAARGKADETLAEETRKMMGEFNLPEGVKLPF
jgi:DNA-binding YbaB/EbfC family protein